MKTGRYFMKKSFFLLLISIFIASSACAIDTGKTKSDKGELSDMKIRVQISSDSGSHKLTATLADNSSARALYDLLKKGPVTIKLNEYGGFEKVGPLGTSLPRNDSHIATKSGDIMLYQGNQITIFYGNNSWSYSCLGKVDGMNQSQLKKILGKGDVTAVFEVLP